MFGYIVDGQMQLNQYGIIARDEWLNTAQKRKNVLIDVFVVMPNHMHAILILDDQCRGEPRSPLGIRTASQEFDEKQLKLNGAAAHSIGAIISGYKSAVTSQSKRMGFEGQLWQRGFHDHIIRNAKSYTTISDYIIDNPGKWVEDKFYSI